MSSQALGSNQINKFNGGLSYGIPSSGFSSASIYIVVEQDIYEIGEIKSMLENITPEIKSKANYRPSKMIDCSTINQLIGDAPNSIYLINSDTITSPMASFTCTSNSNLLGLILVNKEKTSRLKEKTRKLLLMSNVKGITDTSDLQVNVQNIKLCKYGTFDLALGECVEKENAKNFPNMTTHKGGGRKLPDLTAWDDAKLQTGGDVFAAINIFIQDTSATPIELYTQIAGEYYDYFNDLYMLGSEEPVWCDFWIMFSAAYNFFDAAIRDVDTGAITHGDEIKAALDKIIDAFELFVTIDPLDNPYRGCEDVLSNFLDVFVSYLKYYDFNNDGFTDEYGPRLKQSCDLIKAFYVGFNENGYSYPYQDEFYTDSLTVYDSYISVVFTVIEAANTQDSLDDYADEIDTCDCDFCTGDLILLKINILYYNFNHVGDVNAVGLYKTGNMNYDPVTSVDNPTYFEAEALSFNDGCYEETLYANLYEDRANDVIIGCHTDYGFIDCNFAVTTVTPADVEVEYLPTNFGCYVLTYVCPVGQYFDLTTGCTDCGNNCAECDSESPCDTCESNYVDTDGDGNCECEDGQHDDGTGCSDCGTNCALCTVAGTCDTCESNYVDTDGDGNCECEDGQYDEGTQCVDCGEHCIECNDGLTCETCEPTFINLDNDEKCECNTGEFDDTTQCSECIEFCDICQAATGCSQCEPGYTFVDPDCVEEKPYIKQEYIVDAAYNDDFTEIIIELTHEIKLDDTASTDCTTFFIQDANYGLLGTDPSCTVNGNDLEITLGDNWGNLNGEDLNLHPTLLVVGGDEFAPPQDQVIATITTDSTPDVVIEGLTDVVIECDKLQLAYTSSKSTGSLPETWTYLWEVDTAIAYSATSLTAASIILSDINESGPITVTLTITNFFGLSSSDSVTVTVTSTGKKITVELDVKDAITIHRTDSKTIQATVDDLCGLTGDLTYSWNIVPEDFASANVDEQPYDYLNKYYILSDSLRTTEDLESTYNLCVTATLDADDGNTYTDDDCTEITVLGSQIVALYNRVDGEVSKNYPRFTVDGNPSYDPDGFPITTYQWTSTTITFPDPGNTAMFDVSSSYYNTVTSFDLTLTVWTEDGRTDSITRYFDVLDDDSFTDTEITWDDRVKRAWSIKTKIRAYVSTPLETTVEPISLKWTQTQGTTQTIRSSTKTFVTFMPSTLTQGDEYTFVLTATANSFSNQHFVNFRINEGAMCPENSIVVVPSPTAAKGEYITFTISGCYDKDNEDLPITYSYGYKTSETGRVNKLTLPSEGASFSYKFSTSIVIGNFRVCDNLIDCSDNDSEIITLSRRDYRMLSDEEDLAEKYKEDLTMADPAIVISSFLSAYTIPEDLLDTMWNDFVIYIDDQEINLGTLGVIDSVVYLFLGELQIDSINLERTTKYTNFLLHAIDEVEEEINEDENYRLTEIAGRIVDINSDIEYILLAEQIVVVLGEKEEEPMIEYTLDSHRVNAYFTEDSVEDLNLSPISLGNSIITTTDLGIPADYVVEINAFSHTLDDFSDVVFIGIYPYGYYEGSDLVEDTSFEIDIPDGGLIISMDAKGHDNLDCAYYDSEDWVRDSCTVESVKDGVAYVHVTKNGHYKLVSGTESSSMVPLYLIISFIALAAVIIPFTIYFDKTAHYLSPPTMSVPTETGTDKEFKFPAEMQPSPAQNRSFIYNHLLISLLVANQIFTRTKRFVLIIGNIVFEILLQNLFMQHSALSAAPAGVVSALCVLPISAVICLFFSRSGKFRSIVGFTLVSLMYAASVIGILFTVVSQGWLVAFLVGLATEIAVSETILMLLVKV